MESGKCAAEGSGSRGWGKCIWVLIRNGAGLLLLLTSSALSTSGQAGWGSNYTQWLTLELTCFPPHFALMQDPGNNGEAVVTFSHFLVHTNKPLKLGFTMAYVVNSYAYAYLSSRVCLQYMKQLT